MLHYCKLHVCKLHTCKVQVGNLRRSGKKNIAILYSKLAVFQSNYSSLYPDAFL